MCVFFIMFTNDLFEDTYQTFILINANGKICTMYVGRLTCCIAVFHIMKSKVREAIITTKNIILNAK